MSDIGFIALLFGIGALVLLAEIFLPSHGVLTVVGVGFLVTAVVRTFMDHGRNAGAVAVVTCLVALPTFGYLSIKYWKRTPIGRRIAPDNPVLTSADTTVPVEELRRLIGQCGRTISPLRPVGVCDFGGRRIACVTELGMVDAGVEVIATGIRSGNLAVSPQSA
jgi:membrane-bound serine protease (ClpP class)